LIAFEQGRRVFIAGESPNLIKKFCQTGRLFGNFIIIPGRCGIGREKKQVGKIIRWRKEQGSHIQYRGNQYDAIHGYPFFLQIIHDAGAAEGAVAFSEQIFW